MVSNDCLRSQGQPPGARSRAMIAADSSNSAAARAGSVFRSGPGFVGVVTACAVELSGGRSMHPQSTAPTVYSTQPMIRILGTIFAGLLGLAFGSFLNVCLTRWPEDESIVHPRSHCRNCDHALAWWENIPL